MAYLAAQRYRARASARDAVLAWTFAILAGTNVMLSAVPMVTSGSRPWGTLLWAVMGLRLAGAAGMCAAAFADVAAPSPDMVRRHLVVVTAGVAVLVVVGAGAAGATAIDGVLFSASDIDSPGSALTFSVSPVLNDLALGTATATASGRSQAFGGRLNAAAGTYPLTVTASDGAGGTVTAPLSVVVSKENAAVTDFQPPATVVDGTDGDVENLKVTMTISEADDGHPSSTLSAGAGLANARPAALSLTPVGVGSSFGCPAPGANNTAYVAGATVPGTATADCTIINVTVNVYQADATIGGDHSTGGGTGAVTVYDPSAGFTTGGGQFRLPDGTKVSFGFNAKYLKSKQIQGSSLAIFHRPGGNHVVKSNAMGALAVRSATDASGPFWAATLTGKSTYQVPADGVLYCGTNKCGNYAFTVYVEDRREPGAGADRYWFQVKDPNTGQPVPLASLDTNAVTTAAANVVTIAGGNIQIPH